MRRAWDPDRVNGAIWHYLQPFVVGFLDFSAGSLFLIYQVLLYGTLSFLLYGNYFSSPLRCSRNKLAHDGPYNCYYRAYKVDSSRHYCESIIGTFSHGVMSPCGNRPQLSSFGRVLSARCSLMDPSALGTHPKSQKQRPQWETLGRLARYNTGASPDND